MSLYLKELTVNSDPQLMATFEAERRTAVAHCSLFDHFANTALLATNPSGFVQLANLANGTFHTFLTHLGGVDVPMAAPLRFAALSPALYLAHRECHHIFFSLAHGGELLCGNVNTGTVSTIAAFSSRPSAIFADGEYAVCGTAGGEVHCWRAATLLYDGALLRTRPQGVANMSIERSLVASASMVGGTIGLGGGAGMAMGLLGGGGGDVSGVGANNNYCGGGDIHPATFVNDSGSILFRVKAHKAAISALKVYRDWLFVAAEDYSVTVHSMGFATSMDTSFPSSATSGAAAAGGLGAGSASAAPGAMLLRLPHQSSVVRAIVGLSPLHQRLCLASENGCLTVFQFNSNSSAQPLTPTNANNSISASVWDLLGSHYISFSSSADSGAGCRRPAAVTCATYRNGFVIVGTSDGRVIVLDGREDFFAAANNNNNKKNPNATSAKSNVKGQQQHNHNNGGAFFSASSNPVLEELVTFDVGGPFVAVVAAQILKGDVLVVATSTGDIWRWPMADVMASVAAERAKKEGNEEEEGKKVAGGATAGDGDDDEYPTAEHQDVHENDNEGRKPIEVEISAADHNENNENENDANGSPSAGSGYGNASSDSTDPSPNALPARLHRQQPHSSGNDPNAERGQQQPPSSSTSLPFAFDQDALGYKADGAAEYGEDEHEDEEEEGGSMALSHHRVALNNNNNKSILSHSTLAVSSILKRGGDRNRGEAASEAAHFGRGSSVSEKHFPSRVSIVDGHTGEVVSLDGGGGATDDAADVEVSVHHRKFVGKNNSNQTNKSRSSRPHSKAAAAAAANSGYDPSRYAAGGEDDDKHGDGEEGHYMYDDDDFNPADAALALYNNASERSTIHRKGTTPASALSLAGPRGTASCRIAPMVAAVAVGGGLKEGRRMDPRRVSYGLSVARALEAEAEAADEEGADRESRAGNSTNRNINEVGGRGGKAEGRGEGNGNKTNDAAFPLDLSRAEEEIEAFMRANPAAVNALRIKHGMNSAPSTSAASPSGAARGGGTFGRREKVFGAVPELAAPLNKHHQNDDLVDATFLKYARKVDERFEREKALPAPLISRHGCEDLLFGRSAASTYASLSRHQQQQQKRADNNGAVSTTASSMPLGDRTRAAANAANHLRSSSDSAGASAKEAASAASADPRTGDAQSAPTAANSWGYFVDGDVIIPPPATTIFFAHDAFSSAAAASPFGLPFSSSAAASPSSLFGSGPFEDYFIQSLPLAQ